MKSPQVSNVVEEEVLQHWLFAFMMFSSPRLTGTKRWVETGTSFGSDFDDNIVEETSVEPICSSNFCEYSHSCDNCWIIWEEMSVLEPWWKFYMLLLNFKTSYQTLWAGGGSGLSILVGQIFFIK